jgi:hypothetical protein
MKNALSRYFPRALAERIIDEGKTELTPDYGKRCLEAALAMQAKIRELAHKWEPLAGIDLKVRKGKAPPGEKRMVSVKGYAEKIEAYVIKTGRSLTSPER